MENKPEHNKKFTEPQYKSASIGSIQHFHFSVIDSTNTWSKENVGKWAAHALTLVTAAEQTGGRGRFKRHWESPKGVNIYATFCFLVDKKRPDIGQIPQLLALSAVQIVEELKFFPTIKWPNDVMLNGKKMAGILCETIEYEGKLGVVCGIGLNVNMTLETINKIDQPATSLFVESGKEYPVEDIAEKLAKYFGMNLQIFMLAGFSTFFEAFQSRSHYQPGQVICVQDGMHTWQGEFVCLNPDGSISLKLQDGAVKVCLSGEIIQ